MSLVEKLFDTGRHIAQHTLAGIRLLPYTTIGLLAIPTSFRCLIEEESKKDGWNTQFLESVILNTSVFVSAPLIGSIAYHTRLGAVAFGAGNLCSLVYEIHRKYTNYKTNRELGEQVKKIHKAKKPDLSIRVTFDNIVPTFTLTLSERIKSLTFKSIAKAGLRETSTYLTAYALASFIAFSHFTLSEKLFPPTINMNLRNTNIQKFMLQDKQGNPHRFYFLSEMHNYNLSSTAYTYAFLSTHTIDVILTEGLDRSNNTSELSRLETIGFSIADAFFRYGAHMLYEDPVTLCEESGFPTVYLEKHEPHEMREGVLPLGRVILGLASVGGCLAGPAHYFWGLSYRQISVKNLSIPDMGLVNKRNRIMTPRIMNYFEEHPKSICLIRMGLAHKPGVIKLLEEYGRLVNGQEYSPTNTEVVQLLRKQRKHSKP